MTVGHIFSLPRDILVKIFLETSQEPLFQTSMVCKLFREVMDKAYGHSWRTFTMPTGLICLEGYRERINITQEGLSPELQDAPLHLFKNLAVSIYFDYPTLYPSPTIYPSSHVLRTFQDAAKRESMKLLPIIWEKIRPHFPTYRTNSNSNLPVLSTFEEAEAFIRDQELLGNHFPDPLNAKQISAWIRDQDNKELTKKITFLQLSNLGIKVLPAEIGEFTSLTSLILDNNHLVHMPKEIGNLTSLEVLTIMNNQLRKLPKEIGNLTILREFYLSDNQIQEIPKEIGSMKSLTTLFIHNNQISEVPKELGRLKMLTFLNLQNNRLKKIPEEISELTALTHLNLSDNLIEELPKEVKSLFFPNKIFIIGNPVAATLFDNPLFSQTTKETLREAEKFNANNARVIRTLDNSRSKDSCTLS